MNKKYNFISGLPRSGSSVLASILNQNPRFTANGSDALSSYVSSIIKDMTVYHGIAEHKKSIQKRKDIIQGLFDSFYKSDNEICFNSGRSWLTQTDLLKSIFPEFKMIVCIRDVPWILDSFEKHNRETPFMLKPYYAYQKINSIYDRCDILTTSTGVVYGPLQAVRQGMFCKNTEHIFFVEYDALIKEPLITMTQIYEFLQEPWYEHDFNNVGTSFEEFDIPLNSDGLHTVRNTVEFIERQTVLPPDLWEHYDKFSFWKHELKSNTDNLNWLGYL
jgi:sulfotransferase